MSSWDRYDSRRQEERDWERRRTEQEAREQRRRFEMELASRLTNNSEALQVLSGLEDDRLINQVMGLITELRVPIDELDLDEDAINQIKAVYNNQILLSEDKKHLALMWLAAGLDKRIKHIESEIATTSVADSGGRLQLFSRLHELQEKRELVMQQVRELHNQGLERIKSGK
jgi:hypothetical protein